MEFSRPEHWSGWSFPSPGDLPNPGMNLGLPHCGQILYQLSHKGSPLRGKFTATQETRKTSNRQPNFTPKTTGKRRRTTTKKPKIRRRKEIIKNRAELNEKEINKQY